MFCSIAGAPVPLGFGPAIASLIERRAIDVLDITGAQLTHDLLEVIGSLHYQGRVDADDRALVKPEVNRFWDTFGDEADYRRVEPMIFEFAQALPDRPMTTREYMYRMGLFFKKIGSQAGFITAAADHRVRPVYCPAIGDSVLGMDLGLFRAEGKQEDRLRCRTGRAGDGGDRPARGGVGLRTSNVIFGGGAPRNHIQQSQIGTYMFMTKGKGHAEAVRFSIEPARPAGSRDRRSPRASAGRSSTRMSKLPKSFSTRNLSIAISAALVAAREPAAASSSATKTMARLASCTGTERTTCPRSTASNDAPMH